MLTLPDENIKLIQDIKKGNRDSFRALYDVMFSPLYAFGCKYLTESLLVEDIVQEAFISFWQHRDNFDAFPAIKSYLYTTVRNNCLNQIKHKAVEKKHEGSLAYQIESDHYFENAVIEEETFNSLYQEIKHLPPSTQQVMLLALNGLTNPKIAEELGISVNTVKTLKKNGYATLRDKLSPVLRIVLALHLL